jgi:L,D-transpeptidase ErfK/SrfK
MDSMPERDQLNAARVSPPDPGGSVTPTGRLGRALVSASRASLWIWIGALLLIIVGAAAWTGTGYIYLPLVSSQEPAGGIPEAAGTTRWTREQVVLENRRLASRLERLAPAGIHVIIDQTQNRLYLKQGDRTLLTAVCSSGSGMVLRQKGTDRSWVFDTPRGRFTVQSKMTNPVWRRPDWAFVEESLPIPRNPAERLEYGSLGEYALYLGDGYMIHGTLYERLLGRSVTHGCIRLGRDDLRMVYKLVPIGTPVYIY